jgi:citrate synthase
MTGAELLKYFQDHWPTNKGAWIPGEAVRYRDKSLFDDFADRSWFALMLYGLNGEMLSESQAMVVQRIWAISASFPDPRLWNNRVAALAGTTRSTGSLALAAATAVTEAKIYGARPVFLGAMFLRDIRDRAEAPAELEAFILDKLDSERVLPGFGRPLISADERIVPLLAEFDKLGAGNGLYVSLVEQIEAILAKHRYRLKPNIAIYCAAAFLDLGFDPRQSYLIAVLAFSAGMFPCYIDAEEKKEGMLFPLDCHSIRYSGHGKRQFQQN